MDQIIHTILLALFLFGSVAETQPHVYQLLLIFSSDIGTWCKEWSEFFTQPGD